MQRFNLEYILYKLQYCKTKYLKQKKKWFYNTSAVFETFVLLTGHLFCKPQSLFKCKIYTCSVYCSTECNLKTNKQWFTFSRTKLCIHGCTVYHTTCSWFPAHPRQSRSWRIPRSPSSVPPFSNLMDKDMDDLPLGLVINKLPGCCKSSLTPPHCDVVLFLWYV